MRETIQKALVRESQLAGDAPERVMFTDPKMLGDSPGPGAYAPKPDIYLAFRLQLIGKFVVLTLMFSSALPLLYLITAGLTYVT